MLLIQSTQTCRPARRCQSRQDNALRACATSFPAFSHHQSGDRAAPSSDITPLEQHPQQSTEVVCSQITLKNNRYPIVYTQRPALRISSSGHSAGRQRCALPQATQQQILINAMVAPHAVHTTQCADRQQQVTCDQFYTTI